MKAPRRFRRRLAIVALLLATIPAVAIGVALIRVNQDALETTNRELLFAVTADVANQIDRETGDAKTALIAVARMLGDSTLQIGPRIAAAKEIVAASPSLDVVAIFDDTGARVDVIRDVAAKTPVPDRLPEALRSAAGAPQAGDVTASPTGIILPMVMPIKLPETMWYAYAPVSLTGLGDGLAQIAKASFHDAPESVFVVDRELRVVADSNPERAQAMSRAHLGVLEDSFQFQGSNQFLAFHAYAGPDGESMIAAIRSIPSLPFAVVAQIPTSQAYASISRMRVIVIAIVILAILISATLAIVLARRISAPVGRLVKFAGDLAARRFDAPIDVKTGDELEVLGEAMSGAARALSASEDQLRSEAAIRADLGRYLPRQLVDKVVSREQSLELGGQKKQVTVMFADVTAFTSLVEQLAPEKVVAVLNQLFTILTEIVFRHGGTVDKFIGDCVMAFWNAPDDQADHAARAVAASVDMMRWLEVANEAWRARDGVTVHLAIGINTGDVVIGNFGSERRMEYTCIGDAVNLAARLESIARPLQILVSRATHDAAATGFEYFHIGPHRIHGRLEPVDIFEVSP